MHGLAIVAPAGSCFMPTGYAVTVGVAGAILAPVWAAVGAIAAMVANLSIEVEREEGFERGADLAAAAEALRIDRGGGHDGTIQHEGEEVGAVVQLRPGAAVTGSALFTGSFRGLERRYGLVHAAGRLSQVLGPMCTASEARRWLAEAGAPGARIEMSGGIGYFRAVKEPVAA